VGRRRDRVRLERLSSLNSFRLARAATTVLRPCRPHCRNVREKRNKSGEGSWYRGFQPGKVCALIALCAIIPPIWLKGMDCFSSSMIVLPTEWALPRHIVVLSCQRRIYCKRTPGRTLSPPGLRSMCENSIFEGYGLQAVHLTIKMDRLQPLRATNSAARDALRG
jgi:hypothetical protein